MCNFLYRATSRDDRILMTGGQDNSHTNGIMSYFELTVNVKLSMIAVIKCSTTRNTTEYHYIFLLHWPQGRFSL